MIWCQCSGTTPAGRQGLRPALASTTRTSSTPDLAWSAGRPFIGIEGLRAGWLDWLTPWATYRIEVEKAIDLGDQVLLLHRSFGRLEGSTQEVEFRGANLWTIRDGRIARLETYTTHEEALKAVGLAE